MHAIEPYYQWRTYYTAEEDKQSPFYRRDYSEFYYTNSVYDYMLHPQWDDFGSNTLYLKILFVDYEDRFAIIELIGEWNDCINNDIMFLKREVIDALAIHDINKFMLIGENVLNFHFEATDYYEEWFDENDEGWIAGINFRQHVREEMSENNIDYYVNLGGELDELNWRTYQPSLLYDKVSSILQRRLSPASET